jgi:hypothetical protein
MRKLFSVLVLLAFAGGSVTAFAGGETQNGGGAAEQNFAYAFSILSPLYKMCLATDQCVSNAAQKKILQAISDHLGVEQAVADLIRFDSGKANPARFLLNGQMRIAETSLTYGSPIYVNRDMIYRHNGDDVTPYSVSEAVGVLTHELGHHTGEKDHDILDLLGGGVRAFFELQQDRVRLDTFTDPWDLADVALNAFHVRQEMAPFAYRSLMWLSVGDKVYDLNDEVKNKLKCPKGDNGAGTLLGYRLSHLRWNDAGPYLNGIVQIPLEGQVWIECSANADGTGVLDTRQFKVTILFPFTPRDQRLDYRENALTTLIEPIR